ncbi:MAG: glycosyltransferase family 4 protein [Sedimenticola sp.]
MKVLFITYSHIGLNNGGLQNQIKNTEIALNSIGVEVIYFNPWLDQINEVDVLHVFSLEGSALPYIRRARLNGKPVIVTSVYNSFSGNSFIDVLKHKISVLPAIYNNITKSKTMLGLADAVVTLNEKEGHYLERVFGICPDKISVIPNGIDIRFKEGDPDLVREKLGINKFALMIGSITNNKNQLSMIKASSMAGVNLVIVGAASKENDAYYKQCVEKAGSNVFFLGYLEANDPLLASCYMASNLLMLPSFKEVMPLVIYEAGMAGCNIAVSDCVVVDKVIEPFVYRFNPHSVDEMANVLIKGGDEKNSEIQNAVQNMMTWNDVASEYASLYRKFSNNIIL